MPTAWLKLPHLTQINDGYCLPACISMVLAYWQQPVTQEQVGILLGASGYGVPGSRVRRLEKWGYNVSYREATLAELKNWIQLNLPPIVLVETEFLDYWQISTTHAVVLVGLDNEFVYLNDPAFTIAPQKASWNGFLAAWAEMDNLAAVIEL